MPQTFPSQLAVSKLKQTHAHYDECEKTWRDIKTLHTGGYALERQIAQFLRQRPKELSDVLQIRQRNASYTNLMGNIIGWYESALWQQPPTIETTPESDEIKAFRAAWEKDVTRTGVALIPFLQRVVEGMLLQGTQFVLLDMPDSGSASTLADQQRVRGLDPFLIRYEPTDVINWAEDELGGLQWAVVYVRETQAQFAADPVVTDCWYYYDREQVAKYERVIDAKDKGGSELYAQLAPGYPRPHATAKIGKMPLYRVGVPAGLWFGNRVKLPLLNHFNLDNALDFGLFQSCLAQLVVVGEYDSNHGQTQNITISEVGYHKLPEGGNMFFLEPEGKSYGASQARLDNLEERIYKACYLQDQARTNSSTPTAQSGISKSQDKMPARDALSGIGDALRPIIENIYTDVLAVRGFAGATVNVRGFDFNDKAISEIELIDAASVVSIKSPTYERKVQKRVARLVLPDENPDELAKIEAEIDANPTPSEELQQQMQQQQATAALKFTNAIQRVAS